MLCSRCMKLPREAAAPPVAERGPQSLPGWDRLKFIMCACCGELLKGAVTDSTLDKLSALARFGLAAGTPTLMEP